MPNPVCTVLVPREFRNSDDRQAVLCRSESGAFGTHWIVVPVNCQQQISQKKILRATLEAAPSKLVAYDTR
jgi:hypothetical protein